MQSSIPVKQQPHGVSLYPQSWLHPNPHIAQLNAGDHGIACTHMLYALTHSLFPLLNHDALISRNHPYSVVLSANHEYAAMQICSTTADKGKRR